MRQTKVSLFKPEVIHAIFIPCWLSPDDPRPAAEQLDEYYRHGGWRPFEGFKFDKAKGTIKYPGDPAHEPLAGMWLRDEMVLIYEHGWVAIVQKDGSFAVCRMD